MIVLRFWREALIVAVVLALGVTVQRWKTALRNQGIAEERYRVADSTLKAVTPKLARVDTLVVRDTVKVRVAINHVVTMTDTVLHHLTDTVLVKQFVTKADSAAKACSELSNDCQAFRAYATQTINALNQKLAAAPQAKPVHHFAQDILWFTLGAAGGYLAHR